MANYKSSIEGLKIVGSIDLAQIGKKALNIYDSMQTSEKGIRILWATIKDGNRLYDVKFMDDNRKYDGVGYSLIIGPNGVGKSFILRAIIDFYIDLAYYKEKKSLRRHTKNRYEIETIKYNIGCDIIEIRRIESSFQIFVNEDECDLKSDVIPNIVAAHFGLYDRFPIGTRNYDVPFYHYVGAKAGGNFVTTNNIITQMFFALCEEKEDDVINRLVEVFDRIDYEPHVSIGGRLKVKETFTSSLLLRERIMNMNITSTSFSYPAYKRVLKYTKVQWNELFKTYSLLQNKVYNEEILSLDLRDKVQFDENRKMFSKIFILKQLQIVDKLSYSFYRNGERIDCNELSSGEANMLATIISIASSINDKCNLVLLDEPELNQHPNWQMGIISLLNDVLKDYPCHFLIATHSHFLVSDLPMDRSSVIQMNYDKVKGLISNLVGEDTYGWSAEQILLQVFHTSTDRNIYFADIVGKLLERIKDNNITRGEVEKELAFIKKVSEHLHDNDPMKTISKTILDEFEY